MCGIVGYVGRQERGRASSWRASRSSSTAATTRPAWRCWAPEGLQVRRAAGTLKEPRGAAARAARWRARSASATRAGPPTAVPPTRTRIPTPTAPAIWWWSTTASSRTTSPIKERLIAEGHVFTSETDTEVIAHLIERHLRDTPRLAEADAPGARASCAGSYAIVVLSRRARPTGWSRPSTAPAAWWWGSARARTSSPPTSRRSSRTPATWSSSRTATWRWSRATASRSPRSTARPSSARPPRILWDPILAEKGGYRHFMLKEIHEQPRAVADTLRGRVAPESGSVVLPDVEPRSRDSCRRIQRVVLVACGTSYHAALVGRVPDRAARRAPRRGRLRLRVPLPRRPSSGPDTLVVAISPVRRDRGHPGRRQGGRERRRAHRRHQQRGGLGARARGDRHRSTPTPAPRSAWPRTKAFTTQIMALLPARRSGSAASAAPSPPRTGRQHCRACSSCRG